MVLRLGSDVIEDCGVPWHKDDPKRTAGGRGGGLDGLQREEMAWPRGRAQKVHNMCSQDTRFEFCLGNLLVLPL